MVALMTHSINCISMNKHIFNIAEAFSIKLTVHGWEASQMIINTQVTCIASRLQYTLDSSLSMSKNGL